MSRTRHHGRSKRFWKKYWDDYVKKDSFEPFTPWDKRYDVPNWAYFDYASSPGWFIREYMTRPARVRSKIMCKLVQKDSELDLSFPDYKKPYLYYW